MQAFVAVALRYRQPVAQSLGVRLIHVGNNAVGLPALSLLLLQRRIEYDTYGKEVIHSLKLTFLLLHLLPDGVYALCASLDMKFQSLLRQLLLNGLDEVVDIFVAGRLGGVQLLFDMVVGIVLQYLERDILQLALYLI